MTPEVYLFRRLELILMPAVEGTLGTATTLGVLALNAVAIAVVTLQPARLLRNLRIASRRVSHSMRTASHRFSLRVAR